jgi:hypothetical protein
MEKALKKYEPARGPTQKSIALRPDDLNEVSVDMKRTIRANVKRLEDQIMISPNKIDLPRTDHFAPGLYARELFMPKGSVITSLIHKFDHFTFILYGRALVVSEGQLGQVLEGPCMIKTPAGTKRALYIVEDSLWVAVHSTEKEEIGDLIDELTSQKHLDDLSGD